MPSLINYRAFTVIPGKGLRFEAESFCLGDDLRELATIEEAHGLMPGDVVWVGGSWWARAVDGWTPLASPQDARFEYEGVPWSETTAADLLRQVELRHSFVAKTRTNHTRKTQTRRSTP
jgi:hypothetical protein